MKIAFVGKGGSGKTTLAGLFTSHLAAEHAPVLAIDADINQHLAVALGATEQQSASWPTLGSHLPLIKQYLRGTNPRLASAAEMIKTTPAGSGSRLLSIAGSNPIYDACVRELGGARLAVTGPFADDDLGVSCYHSKVGAVELLFNHLIDGPGEYAVVDMTAGADSFASGLFTRFDLTVLVCEPTVRSISVYRQYLGYAKDFDVNIAVVGNKISDADDLAFLREHVGDHLIATMSRSDHVRAAERGDVRPIGELEPPNMAALSRIRLELDGCERDWARYQQLAVEFHLKNAAAWGNDSSGVDLSTQIDPDFVLGPLLSV
jgi:CO dehydrogenase maturation factor